MPMEQLPFPKLLQNSIQKIIVLFAFNHFLKYQSNKKTDSK